MSDSRELVYKTDSGEVKLTRGIVRDLLVSGDREAISDKEIVTFMMLCKYQSLNPFLREAYLVKYGADPATIVVGKETFTKRANKAQGFRGFEAGVWVMGRNEELVQRKGAMTLPSETLVGGWARIHREGWEIPLEVSVSLEEYMGRKKSGEPNRQWARMPGTMIRKVALVQALREAFPENFAGLYDSSEMQVDADSVPEDPVDVTPEDDEMRLKREITDLVSDPEVFSEEKRRAVLEEIEQITSVTTLEVLKKRLLHAAATTPEESSEPEEQTSEASEEIEGTEPEAQNESDSAEHNESEENELF